MDAQGSVRLARMFCPAQDRNVPILLRDRRDAAVQAPHDGTPEPLSCLEYGVRCTGWLCPHFAAPTLPPENLLEEALEVERRRRGRVARERRSILERALREGRQRRTRQERFGAEDRPHAGPLGSSVQPSG